MVTDPLASTEWLASRPDSAAVRILDATWFTPSAGPEEPAAFEQARIRSALFFEVDAVADRSTDLPRRLPPPGDPNRRRRRSA